MYAQTNKNVEIVKRLTKVLDGNLQIYITGCVRHFIEEAGIATPKNFKNLNF